MGVGLTSASAAPKSCRSEPCRCGAAAHAVAVLDCTRGVQDCV